MREKKNKHIQIRVTKKEYKKIKEEAEKQKTTITALILNSLENNLTINLNTSDYEDLVIQVRKIGYNINSIIRDINFKKVITQEDIGKMKKYLSNVEYILDNERKNIRKTKKDFENLTTSQLKNMLEKTKKEIPNYLIYDEIGDHIIYQVRIFIDFIFKSDLDNNNATYFEYFLRDFNPTHFEYNELVNMSNNLDEEIKEIDKLTLGNPKKLTEGILLYLLDDVLDKYRIDSDE